MAAASVWAVTGSVTSTVSAPAVLTHGAGQLRPAEPRRGPGHRRPRRNGPAAARGRPRPHGAHPQARSRCAAGQQVPAGRVGRRTWPGDHRARRHRRADHLRRCERRRRGEGRPRRRPAVRDASTSPRENAASIPARRAVDLTVRSVPPTRVRRAARPGEVGRPAPPSRRSRSPRSSATASSVSSSPRRAARWPSWSGWTPSRRGTKSGYALVLRRRPAVPAQPP